jgi:hypothetical protein
VEQSVEQLRKAKLGDFFRIWEMLENQHVNVREPKNARKPHLCCLSRVAATG